MTAEKVDSWMPLWIGAYLADTMNLSTIQHGAYLLLLMSYWRDRAALDDDDESLRAITKTDRSEWKKMRPTLARFFRVENGVWWHKRVEAEIAKATGNRTTAKEKATGKWGSDPEHSGRELRSKRLSDARRKGTHTPLEWEVMKTIHSHSCVRCAAKDVELVKDHITPLYQGGSDAIDNIQPLCRKCNASKGPEAIDYRINAWKNALDAGIKCLPNASSTPSPLPIEVEREGVNPKSVCVVLGDTHTKISENFTEIIRTIRPELNAAEVYAGFLAHYRPELRTEARWRKWVQLEIAPPGAAPPAAADPDSRAAVEAAGVKIGIGKWDELREPWATYKARVRGAPVPGEFA